MSSALTNRTESQSRRASEDLQRQADRQQAADDMRWLMADERGRRLVWQWLSDGGIFRSTYTGDALSSAFKEGERNAAIRLHAQVMQHAGEQFIRMLSEAQRTPSEDAR